MDLWLKDMGKAVSYALAKCKYMGKASSILQSYVIREDYRFSSHSFVSFRSRDIGC